MKNKFLITFVFLLILGALSSCSDFRKAVGKEKVIPDEFSVAVTPSLLIPPGYKIDPQLLKQNKSEGVNNNFSLSEEIDIKNINWCTPFNEIDDVMLEYNLIQYGIEMKFKAINISETKVSDDFLKIDEDYEFSAVNKYLKEVKSILSIFSCK